MRCFTATYKKRNSTCCFPFVKVGSLVPHMTELSNGFQAVCFDFAQVKASVEMCINKLPDAAAKSEFKLIVKSWIVN